MYDWIENEEWAAQVNKITPNHVIIAMNCH